jgi:EamA domain-containing membrane protein RarD
VVRLGRWANSTSPLKLVAYKATTKLILDIVLLIVLAGIAATTTTTTTTDVMVHDSGLWVFLQESGREIVNFIIVVSERLAAGTLPWLSIQMALTVLYRRHIRHMHKVLVNVKCHQPIPI